METTTHIGTAKIKTLAIPSAGNVVELELEFSSIADGNAKWHKHYGKECSF